MLRLIALLSLLVLGSSARAEPPRRPALHWSRGEGASACIDPHALALRVTALTGPVLVDATEADVSIEGHITLLQGVYVARITATGQGGVSRGARTLRQTGDCRGLDQALAFVIALLIDPDLVLERLPQELVTLGAEGEAPQSRLLTELEAEPPRGSAPAAATPPAQPEARPMPAESLAREPAPASPRPTVYQLHLGATIASRELPRGSAGLYVALGIAPLRWLGLDLALRAAFMPGPVELEGGREINAQRFSGGVLACPRYPWATMFIELCAGPQAVLIRARGKGFASDDVSRRAAFAAQVAAGFSAQLVRAWWLRLRGQVELLLNDPSFRYTAQDPEPYAFDIERIAYGADLGVAYQF